jgi:tetratricopeptide (TPR) repeat protein
VFDAALQRAHQQGDSGVGLTAFMSYSRFDDTHDDNALTLLREELSAEVQSNVGLPFLIFQDTEDVRWGDDWEHRISTAVQEAAFLIPVVTPSFLKRNWCRQEVVLFDARQRRQAVRQIFPIHYITTPAFEDSEVQRTDGVVRVLTRANWIDWRDLRFAERGSSVRRQRLVGMAQHLAKAIDDLRKKLTPFREQQAHDLFGVSLDLVEKNPKQAITVIDRLLEDYPDCPLIYRSWALITRARALALLGHQQAAIEQLDLYGESLRKAFPRGEPKDDPVIAHMIEPHLAAARLTREAIISGKDF